MKISLNKTKIIDGTKAMKTKTCFIFYTNECEKSGHFHIIKCSSQLGFYYLAFFIMGFFDLNTASTARYKHEEVPTHISLFLFL